MLFEAFLLILNSVCLDNVGVAALNSNTSKSSKKSTKIEATGLGTI